MNHEKLKKAQDSLEIQEVLQRSCAASLANGYVPQNEGMPAEFNVQFRHLVARSETIEARTASGTVTYLFRVFIDLGMRWGMPDDDTSKLVSSEDALVSKDDNADKDAEMLGTIEASYVAQYLLADPNLNPDSLDEFALNNASYHVWPYFREFVSAQCARMGVPRITMPMLQLAHNRQQGVTAEPHVDLPKKLS